MSEQRDNPQLTELMRWDEIVEKIPRERLPGVWCRLNRYEWHPMLGDKPEGWDEMTDEEKHYAMEIPFGIINATCSRKELLRYANTVEDHRMTEAQFEDWWDSIVREEVEKVSDQIRYFRYERPNMTAIFMSSLAAILSLIALLLRLR